MNEMKSIVKQHLNGRASPQEFYFCGMIWFMLASVDEALQSSNLFNGNI
jgi:hypothetical protein